MKNPLKISICLFIFLFCLAFAKSQNHALAKVAVTRNVSSDSAARVSQ